MKIKKIKHNNQGMAAIFTILVVGAASLIVARSVSFLALTRLDSSVLLDKGEEAAYLTEGCAEEALRRIELNHDFLPNGLSFVHGPGECVVTVVSNGNQRSLDIYGNLGNYHKRIQIELDIDNDVLNIARWQNLAL